MSAAALFFWILNAALDTAGHLALKAAAVTEHETEWRRWKTMLSLPVMWLGLGCFVFEFFAWLALLSLIPLSLAVLIGSINIVVVMLAGKLLFHERLDRMRVAGMWLISMGVAMAGGFAGVGT
ncbi:MAG: EamA family transporter [Rhodocyclales bacterium]|nr:EamA family transporter [Rhodocyclales bacterium]